MAFDYQKIDPLDLQPRKAVGVSLPFSAKSVFTSTYQTKDAIRTNLINYFLTNKGERYLNPTFGSDIRKRIFENIGQDEVDDIKDIISTEIAANFPRVITTRVQVTSQPDNNLITIYIQYRVDETNIEDELLINIEQ